LQRVVKPIFQPAKQVFYASGVPKRAIIKKTATTAIFCAHFERELWSIIMKAGQRNNIEKVRQES